MVVPWVRNLSGLLQLGPHELCGIEFKGIWSIVVVVNTSKNYYRVAEYSWLMVGQLSRLSTLAGDMLPGYAVGWIVDETLNALNAESPHVGHWALFDVSSSVDIEIVINNETAVIRSSFG